MPVLLSENLFDQDLIADDTEVVPPRIFNIQRPTTKPTTYNIDGVSVGTSVYIFNNVAGLFGMDDTYTLM